ncbi:MAG TPA: GNAT family N-acetyltransferase [Aggregatilineales bacterium]|nr:GNAT family N-acetyltransferase [Aggregatilineales bacterium]
MITHPAKPRVEVRVVQTDARFARRLAKMQAVIFPTLTDEELFSEEQYLHHIALFPDGQLTALVKYKDDKWVVAGSTVNFLTTWETAMEDHTFPDVIAHGWLDHHNPKGEWIYGADVSVHPEFHGMGVGSALYKARQQVVQRLNLRGEIAGGMIPGYQNYADVYRPDEYIWAVERGDVFDPTLSVQIKNGFHVNRVLYDYITDPRCDNCAAQIVRRNPFYMPVGA